MASPSDNTPDPCEVLPFCPVCGGPMELVYDRLNQKVCVCRDCMTGITIPSSAWEVAKLKRDKVWPLKT